MLSHRQSNLLTGVKPDWAASWDVYAFPIGATIASASAGSTITVEPGHSVVAGDKGLIFHADASTTFTAAVDSVTPTTIVFAPETFSVVKGDLFVNLGADTGTTAPNFDASTMSIWVESDPTQTAITNSRVTTDAAGNYNYYYMGQGAHWEVVVDNTGVVRDVIAGWSAQGGLVHTLANNATPSVAVGNIFKTGGTTTITDFDDGVLGQTITILAAHTMTIADAGGALVLDSSRDFDMASGDTLTLTMYNDQIWNEVGRSVNVTVATLADDGTPTVAGKSIFKTGGTTTITDFDDGVVGQMITVLSAHAVIITHNASIIILDGSANFTMAIGDTLTLVMVDDQVWNEVARVDLDLATP